MQELNDFYNDGYGWVCRHCNKELGARRRRTDGPSRLLTEGEAESKAPELSNRAMAKWADAARRVLICPRCGISELADLA